MRKKAKIKLEKKAAIIAKLMVCRLKGHDIFRLWRNKFNKRKTRRKRIGVKVCSTCLAKHRSAKDFREALAEYE